jgi:hypothetical protein
MDDVKLLRIPVTVISSIESSTLSWARAEWPPPINNAALTAAATGFILNLEFRTIAVSPYCRMTDECLHSYLPGAALRDRGVQTVVLRLGCQADLCRRTGY